MLSLNLKKNNLDSSNSIQDDLALKTIKLDGNSYQMKQNYKIITKT